MIIYWPSFQDPTANSQIKLPTVTCISILGVLRQGPQGQVNLVVAPGLAICCSLFWNKMMWDTNLFLCKNLTFMEGEISHHLASLGKYNSIVGIDQGGPETKISQLYQIWKFRLMPIFGHAHIWPIWAQPHTTQKLKLFKYGHMIYQSKANLTLVKNRNRT